MKYENLNPESGNCNYMKEVPHDWRKSYVNQSSYGRDMKFMIE